MNTFTLGLCLLGMCFCGSLLGQTQSEVMNEISARYKRASPGNEKMKICIEAIDRGLICRGCPIKNFDTLFGTDFSQYVPAPGKHWVTRALDFIETPVPPRPDMQAGGVGWFIAVDFDSDGLIQNYRLTNVHK